MEIEGSSDDSNEYRNKCGPVGPMIFLASWSLSSFGSWKLTPLKSLVAGVLGSSYVEIVVSLRLPSYLHAECEHSWPILSTVQVHIPSLHSAARRTHPSRSRHPRIPFQHRSSPTRRSTPWIAVRQILTVPGLFAAFRHPATVLPWQAGMPIDMPLL